jgi:hypothetical protein
MQTNDSQHQSWRDRAREIRALGDQMHDLLARDEMLRLANKYERLADWTEEQAASPRDAHELSAFRARRSPVEM